MDLCRVCLSGAPETHICELKTSKKYGDKRYSEILQFCLDIHIEVSEDTRRKKLCAKCFKKIITFYKFKSMAQKNDAYLRSMEKESSFIKEELNPIEEIQMSKDNNEPILDSGSEDLKHELKNETNTKFTDDYNCVKHDTKPTLNTLKEESQTGSDVDNTDVEENQAINYSNSSALDNTEAFISILDNLEIETKNNIVTKKNRNQSSISKKSKINKKMKPSTKTGNTELKSYTHSPGVCDQCGAHVKNLKLHAVVHIPKQYRQRYPCNKCDKVFITYTALKVHQKRWHLGKIGHCEQCNKDFIDLKSHQLIMHSRDKLRYECGVCHSRYRHQSALDRHTSLHTKEKAFQCHHCGKHFRLKLLLTQHVRAVHELEKNFVCQHCSKSFFKKYHFMNHLRTHTKEKPFKCSQCDKSFTTTTTLKDHQYVHATVKDYHCKLCAMSFVKAANLRKHMVSHSSEKKFPCRYCGVSFKRSNPRKKHEYDKHEKNMTATQVPLLDCN